MAPSALAQPQTDPIQLSRVDPLGQRQGPRGGLVLSRLETPDPHPLTMPVERLFATTGAVANFFLLFFWVTGKLSIPFKQKSLQDTRRT